MFTFVSLNDIELKDDFFTFKEFIQINILKNKYT